MSDTGNNAKSSVKRVRGNPDKTKPFRFKPGQSGNPSGRPLKKPATELYEKLANDKEFWAQYELSVRKRLLSDRMVGHLEAREMADRLEGKVTQNSNINLNVGLASRVKKALELIRDE